MVGTVISTAVGATPETDRRRRAWVVALSILGLLCLPASYLFGQIHRSDELWDNWVSDLIMGAGITLVLSAFFLYLEKRLEITIEARTDAVVEATQNASLRNEERLQELEASVEARLRQAEDAAREADEAPIRAMQSDATSETVSRAISSEQIEGRLTSEGPRVAIQGTAWHLRFVTFPPELGLGRLWLQVEDAGGEFVTDVPWEEEDAPTVTVDLLTAMRARDGRAQPQLTGIFTALDALLGVVRNNTSLQVQPGPAIELFGKQWLLAETGLHCLHPEIPETYTASGLTPAVRITLAHDPRLNSADLLAALNVVDAMRSPRLEPTFP